MHEAAFTRPPPATQWCEGVPKTIPKLPGWGGAFFSLVTNVDTAGDIESCRHLIDRPVDKRTQPPPGPKQ
eukprot:12887233-Prorocentrum_lima.AAC.1